MTAVLYGVAETPWNDPWQPYVPFQPVAPVVWPLPALPTITKEDLDAIARALQSQHNPCAVCGFPNADEGDSHDRCRSAIERAEKRGAAKASEPRPDAYYWVRITPYDDDVEGGWRIVWWYQGRAFMPGMLAALEPSLIAEWGERVPDREAP